MRHLFYFLFLLPTLVLGQWEVSTKANSLSQFGNIHGIKIDAKASLDSQSLAKSAYAFIQQYYFGEKPKQLVYNGLDGQFGKKACQAWVQEFMESPLIRALPLKEKSSGELANFNVWKKQFNVNKYVLVNIASNELLVYENDSVVLKMKVIVGTKKNQTPIMATYADAIMLYPYWTPTANIIHNEIIPKVKKDVSYLSRNNFEVLDRKGQYVNPESLDWESFSRKNFPYMIRQGTGCDNSLGLLKINIQNPLSIYMHDTPHTTYSKGLFDREKRFFSHGCIRLEKPLELANWLGPILEIDEALMEKCLINQKPQVVQLYEKIPVFLMYFTEYKDENGEIIKAEDFYGLED